MIKTVLYNEEVIQDFAEHLYGRANSIILGSTVFGLIVGAFFAGVGAALLNAHQQLGIVGIAVVVGAVVGGLWGLGRGRERAFKLKLEAQLALCQVQIEKNTIGKSG